MQYFTGYFSEQKNTKKLPHFQIIIYGKADLI